MTTKVTIRVLATLLALLMVASAATATVGGPVQHDTSASTERPTASTGGHVAAATAPGGATAGSADGAAGQSAGSQEFTVPENETVVAIVDTGVDETHPDLQGKELVERSFIDGTDATDDVSGHGTHLAARAVGTGAASNGMNAGAAPGAKYMDLRVAKTPSGGSIAAAVEAIEFASKNGADVISVGLTFAASDAAVENLVAPAIEAATERGSLVVAAAGGNPLKTMANGAPGLATVANAPGADANVLTVAASDPAGTKVMPFSAGGPTPDGSVKPDLVAAGTMVPGATSSSRLGTRLIKSPYTVKAGTTISVGAASGAAARVLAERPDLSVTEVRGLLASTASPFEGQNVYEQGSGLVDLSRAVNASLFVTPGTLDFGVYTADESVSRDVTIHNTGDEARTVSLEASATDVLDGTSGSVSFEESEVTVPANGQRTVSLSVDTGSEGGVFAGRLTATPADGPAMTTSFGYARAFGLTVEKATPDGQSAEGDQVLVQSTRSGFDRAVTLSYAGDGVEALSFGGDVMVGSYGTDEETGEQVLVAEKVTVDGNATVTLDETETVRYEIDASAVESEHGALSSLYLESIIQRRFQGEDSADVFELRAVLGEQQSARFSVGPEFNASIAATMVPESSTGGSSAAFDTPRAYLLHYSTIGVDDPETFSAQPDELARENLTYYRTTPDQTYNVMPYVDTRHWDEASAFNLPMGIGDRVTQTVYVTPETAAYGFGAVSDTTPPFWGERAEFVVPEPDSTRTVVINTHPATGRLLKWNFQDGRLYVKAALQKDLGHEVHKPVGPTPNTFSLEIGDRPPAVVDTHGPGAITPARVPVQPGDPITVYAVGRNKIQPRSERSVGLYHGTYRPDGDSSPPRMGIYWIDRLTVQNTVPAGNVTVRFKVDEESDVRVLGTIGQFDVKSVPATMPQQVVEEAMANDNPKAILDAFVEGEVSLAEVEQTEPGRYTLTADLGHLEDGEPVDVRILAIDEAGNLMMAGAQHATEIGDGTFGPGEGPYKAGEPIPAWTPMDDGSEDDSEDGSETTTEAATTTAESTEETETSTSGQPGFGVAVALLAFLGAALLARRRRT